MKKKIISFLLSMAVLAAILPSQVLAMSNPYSTPSWNPGSTPHPRVMFTTSDIPTIKANLSASQNAQAYYYFLYTINNSSLISSSVSLSSSINSDFGTNADFTMEGEIEMFALFYALYANDENSEYRTLAESCANIAITRMQEYLNQYRYSTSNGMCYRNLGCTIFHASEVFDWCYNYTGFTQSKKDTMISSIETLAKKLDIWNSSANAPSSEGSITGHGSENQLLRDLLAFGIATAGHTTSGGSNRKDIYNAVMGRIQAEYIEPRNDIYRSHTIHQGSEYGWYRFYFDLYAEKLYETAASQSKTPPKTLFDTDLMKEVLYGMIYSRRADGRFFVEGDNKHTDYYYYNNFNRQTPKFAGDLFGNEYFKGEYRRTTGSEGTADDLSSNVFKANSSFKDNRSFNAVQWLIMNDPSVPFTTDRKSLPKSRYFGSPIGKIYATTNWTYSSAKNTTFTSDSVSCEMKIGERYSANHDHLDAGTFQLFYRGLLTGEYGAEGEYGSSYDGNYYKRTVAHNAITINNSNVGFSYDVGTFTTLYNDGGQLGGAETSNVSTWKNNAPYKRATVVNHAIADDNSYSYIKGDITAAYGSKASEVARSMVFLPYSTSRAVMVVYDKVKASGSYAMRFLLHTATEPTITNNCKLVSDNTNTTAYTNGSVTYSGRLTMNTLLPTSATYTKRTAGYVAPSGKTYTVEKTDSKYEPEWGYVEIADNTVSSNTAYFLNVLTVSESGTSVTDATLIGSKTDTFVGAKTGYSQVVMFANKGVDSLPNTQQGTFTVDSGEDLDFFIFGLGEGGWTVLKDGVSIGTFAVTKEEGALSFTNDAGVYTVKPYEHSDLNTNVVAWYDSRKSDTVGGSTWEDISGNVDWDIPILAGHTSWNGSGDSCVLRISGNGTNVTSLPDEIVDTINSGQFTLEFAVKNISAAKDELLSIFGNPRQSFAVYKIGNANKVYLKTPGTKTFMTRPYWQLWANEFASGKGGVNNRHCIITVDTTANDGDGEMIWYLDGQEVTSSTYNAQNTASVINLATEAGTSIDYIQIKVIDRPITSGEASGEFQAYNNKTF